MPLAEFPSLVAIATTPQVAQTLQCLDIPLWVPDTLSVLDGKVRNVRPYECSLKDHLTDIWPHHGAFVFGLAAGAVVRLIAPLLQDKSQDPAIIVVDPAGKFVISLCSGHQGGSDRLAQLIARQLGATAIITGAAASLDLPGIDILGEPFGWERGSGDWTGVSAAIARGETVQVIQDAGSTLWQDHLPDTHPFTFGFPDVGEAGQPPIKPHARIWISSTQHKFAPQSDLPTVQWHPRVLWVGIGCERGTSAKVIASALTQTCQRYHLAPEAIAAIATIDLKANEVGILELARNRQLPLHTFSAEQLRQVEVPNPSVSVEQAVATPSVAEAAALLASRMFFGSQQPSALLAPKHVVRLEGEPGAATVAIAQARLEFTGRGGQLFLVGIGPGQLAQMTPAAQTAVTQADAIIGYSLYIEQIRPLKRPGQIIEAFSITQERDRAQRAIELAQWGLTVAVVSSGDCGIYGMAGLVLEELQHQNWDGKTPQTQIIPGISAVQAAAARVGAPLMHDFCTISLSDRLTPWSTIEQRLKAAAAADFVTALYNPRSQQRTQQIAIAQDIFLKYRAPETPVALVTSAYRPDETITLTTLSEFLQFPVDMMTTVLIGNGTTCHYKNWLITPRGYLTKEQDQAHPNAKRGQ